MREHHGTARDIDRDSAPGTLAILPAAMMVACGILRKSAQRIFELDGAAGDVTAPFDGEMVAKDGRQVSRFVTGISGDIADGSLVAAPVINDLDAATSLPPATPSSPSRSSRPSCPSDGC